MTFRTVFLFPGQGSYLPGVMAGLDISTAAEELAIIDAVANEHGHRAISPLLCDRDSLKLDQLLAADHERADLAIFATSVVLARLLRAEHGVEPDVVLGHSFGEFAALVISGALASDDAARAICACHAAIRSVGLPAGGLLAIESSTARTTSLIAELGEESLEIATENAPTQTVIAGPEAGLVKAATMCRNMHIRAARLRVPGIVHHRFLRAAEQPFRIALRSIPTKPLRIPFLSSCYSNRYLTPEDDVRDVLVALLAHRVRFADALRTLRTDGISKFVECGARDILTRLVTDSHYSALSAAPLRRRVDTAEFAQLLHTVNHR